MRIRLLVSAAALAAALVLSPAALAATAPAITTPAAVPSPFVTNVTPVHLAWGDVPDEAGYRVWRADAGCVTGLVNLTLLSGDLPADSTFSDDSPPADGAYCYWVEAVDPDTSVAASLPVIVHYDGTAPSSALTAPPTGPLTGSVALHATASDPAGGTGVSSVEFQSSPTGAGSWTTFDTGTLNGGVYDGTLDTTSIAGGDGVYDLRARATDGAGNFATSAVVSGVRVDTTAPVVAITAPGVSANVRGTISVDATASDTSGVASVVFQSSPAGAGTWATFATDNLGPGPYSGSLDTTTLAGDGLYDVRALATDVAGNPASLATLTNLRVDNTAPSGALTSPLAAANVRGTIMASATATDGGGTGVASVAFQISPAGANAWTTYDMATSGSPYTGTLNTTTLGGDGLYDLRILVTDVAGNRGPSPAIGGVRVDNTVPPGPVVPNGPVADAKAPASVKKLSAKVSGHTITLTWKNPADKDFDHVEITASERKPAATKAAKRVYSGKGTKARTTLGDGQTRWFRVVAFDRVGNASVAATVRASVAVASPFGPAPNAHVHGKVQLRWPLVKGATYYNVQLYAGTKRIIASWPEGHAASLPKAKLEQGTTYTWYVWPGLGAKSQARYGKLIGKNVFTYAG